MKIKNDKYRSNREGHSVLNNLSCSKCGTRLFAYQKDGIGSLIRLYLDRITFNYTSLNLKKSKGIFCPNCNSLVGNISIYKVEKRLAVFLRR